MKTTTLYRDSIGDILGLYSGFAVEMLYRGQ